MQFEKGKTQSVRVRFRRFGQPAQFAQPPRWTLYNSADDELLSGAAIPVGDEWEANVTLSTNYVVPDGAETLTLQFVARDRFDDTYTVDRELTLVDRVAEWKTDVVLYNRLIDEALTDTLVTPKPLSRIQAAFVDPAGHVVTNAEDAAPALRSRTDEGYTYGIDVGTPPLNNYAYSDPYQLIIKWTATDGTTDSTAHPVYVLTPGMTAMLNSLRMYLDKARMREIDPSLQFHLEELVHFLFEGIKYVNGAPPQGTFWTADNWPVTLQPHLLAAAALSALQSRHLAEGLNAFQFQGLNTSLDYNRTDVLQAHIDMMRTTLESLPQAKRSAIQNFGQGTPPPGVQLQRVSNLGVSAYSHNLLNRGSRMGRGLGLTFR